MREVQRTSTYPGLSMTIEAENLYIPWLIIDSLGAEYRVPKTCLFIFTPVCKISKFETCPLNYTKLYVSECAVIPYRIALISKFTYI